MNERSSNSIRFGKFLVLLLALGLGACGESVFLDLTLTATPHPATATPTSPSATRTPTDVNTVSTKTPTSTPTPSLRPTTGIPTEIPTATATDLATRTSTRTSSPTSPPVDTATATLTSEPTSTATRTPTQTTRPTDTATNTRTSMQTSTATNTASRTSTPTGTSAATETPTLGQTETPTPTDVPTAAATPTSTAIPVDTPTPGTGGAVCGNGFLEPGENFDDPDFGPIGDPAGSECAADAVAAVCTPGDTTRTFEVDFFGAIGTIPTSATLLIGYHSELLSIPGTGASREVRGRVLAESSPFVFTATDFDYALRAIIVRTTPMSDGRQLTMTFDSCTANAVTADDLACTIEGCSGAGGPIDGCSCAIFDPEPQ